MDLLRFYPVLFLVVGNIVITNCQSLLGAVENILGIDEQPTNENANQRYTVLPNANTKQYNYPVHNNLLGNNLNLYNRDPRNRGNTINNLGNVNSNNKYNGLINPTNWLNIGDPKNIQSGVMQKVNQGNYEDEDVKLAAQQYPGLQKLLDRLKELNKQKELEKQQNGNNGQTTATPAVITTENSNNDYPNEPTAKTKEKEKFKVLKRRKFYFQVQPVVPEDQRKAKDLETVYYED